MSAEIQTLLGYHPSAIEQIYQAGRPFSPDAWSVIIFAREHALVEQRPIDTGDLILGITKSRGIAQEALDACGMTAQEVNETITDLDELGFRTGWESVTSTDEDSQGLTIEAVTVLDRAQAIALFDPIAREVDTADILLAVSDDRGATTVAGQVFYQFQIPHEALKEQVNRLRAEHSPEK